jgi:hypothetical protein
MSCNIVIPSHKRADRVSTIQLVSNPILCVAESQKDEYARHNPGVEIVTHPDSVVGLIPKRNWMLKHFRELFMLDDDIMFCQSLHKQVSNSQIKDPEKVRQIIENLYHLAKDLDIKLFGFNKNPRPEQFDVFEPITLRQQITGCAYGVIDDGELYWPEELKLKEDIWISCYCKYLNRKILIDNRYNFAQKDTMRNPGGLSEIRNSQTEMESILYVKKHFGDSIRLKNSQHKAENKKKYNITTTFRF